MNPAALPYTLLVVLVELAAGSLWCLTAIDLRGGVTRGFVLTMALCVAIAGGLALWLAGGLSISGDIDGYRVAGSWFGRFEDAFLAATLLALVYAAAAFMGWDPVGRLAGLAGSAAGLVAVITLAGFLAPPAWGGVGAFVGVAAGALVMGAVAVAMVWGHWYLTGGALPGRPLRDLAAFLVAAEVAQALALALALALPVREQPLPADPVNIDLAANPVLYLRLGVGLVFPFVLALLALRTAQIRAMQSATGLLYIAMAAIFVGEILGKGLMFMTGRPL